MSIKWDTRELSNAIREARKICKVSMPNLVKFAALQFCRSARLQTPGPRRGSIKKTAKKRTIIKNPRYEELKRKRGIKKPARYLIESWAGASKKPRYIPTNKKTDRRAKIKNRGVAQGTWSKAMGELGKVARFAKGESAGKRFMKVKKDLRQKLKASVEITNTLPYMAEIAPNALPVALSKATRALQSRMKKKLASDLKKAWK